MPENHNRSRQRDLVQGARRPEYFYTNVTSLEILNHLTVFFVCIHTVDAINTPQLMKTLFTNTDGIPQFINAMEAVQRKSKLAKIIIQGKYMHAVALKLLLQSGEYETETRYWSKLPDNQQTWTAWEKLSGMRIWRRDGPNQPGKEKTNPLVAPW